MNASKVNSVNNYEFDDINEDDDIQIIRAELEISQENKLVPKLMKSEF